MPCFGRLLVFTACSFDGWLLDGFDLYVMAGFLTALMSPALTSWRSIITEDPPANTGDFLCAPDLGGFANIGASVSVECGSSFGWWI